MSGAVAIARLRVAGDAGADAARLIPARQDLTPGLPRLPSCSREDSEREVAMAAVPADPVGTSDPANPRAHPAGPILGAPLWRGALLLNWDVAGRLVVGVARLNEAYGQLPSDGTDGDVLAAYQSLRADTLSMVPLVRSVTVGALRCGDLLATGSRNGRRMAMTADLWMLFVEESPVDEWLQSTVSIDGATYTQVFVRPSNPVPLTVAAVAFGDIRSADKFFALTFCSGYVETPDPPDLDREEKARARDARMFLEHLKERIQRDIARGRLMPASAPADRGPWTSYGWPEWQSYVLVPDPLPILPNTPAAQRSNANGSARLEIPSPSDGPTSEAEDSSCADSPASQAQRTFAQLLPIIAKNVLDNYKPKNINKNVLKAKMIGVKAQQGKAAIPAKVEGLTSKAFDRVWDDFIKNTDEATANWLTKRGPKGRPLPEEAYDPGT